MVKVPLERLKTAFALAPTRAAAILVCLLLTVSFARGAEDGGPIRAVWVEARGPELATNQGCRDLIERLREMNATDLFVEVYSQGLAYYHSQKVPRPKGFAAKGHDPLGVLLQEARQPGQWPIRVHAVVDFLSVHNDLLPMNEPKGHILNVHPEWLAKDVMGRKRDAGRNLYLDPGVPEVRKYIESLLMEMLTLYGLNGVHFVNWRYPGTEKKWGYNALALKAFRAQSKSIIQIPDPQMIEWTQWRRNQLTSLLVRLSEITRQTRPNAIVSVSALAAGEPPPEKGATSEPTFMGALQDWPSWKKNELTDWVVIEDFHSDKIHPKRFGKWVEFALKTKSPVKTLIAVSGSLNQDSLVLRQIRVALEAKADGAVLYSYQHPAANMTSGSDILDYLGKTVFSPAYVTRLSSPLASATGAGDPFSAPRIVPGAVFQPGDSSVDLPLPGSLPPPLPLETRDYSQSDAAWALLGKKGEKPPESPKKTPQISTMPPIKAVPLVATPTPGPLQEIHLTNGRFFSGRVLKRSEGKTIFQTQRGFKLMLPDEQIDSIGPVKK